MRRAILAVLVTAVGLVLLLSFKPHAMTAVADRPAALSQSGGAPRGDGVQDGGGSAGDDQASDPGGVTTRGDDEGDGEQDDDDDGGLGLATQAPPEPTARPGAGQDANAGAGGGKAVTGDAADTRWGPVQVQVTLSGRKVTAIKVLQSPDGNRRDIVINERALPILTQEALTAQSAQIDTVSGATYTSDGYIRSLQSALDKAGL
ncbi:FMN-binding protein [Sphaerisporangium dianthi]|uniref:FMN-binding protein n=1 Tax=Sphaerisporangium dianthi TaxID=1436120 RepID=A0ABV9CP95_9ACTN